MKTHLKCSNCGAEISNLNMSWGKKQWVWFIPLRVMMLSIPLMIEFLFEDDNDFRMDLSIVNVDKSYINGVLEVKGTIENHGKVNWESIVVEAELFDKKGKFLDEIKGHIGGNLAPGTIEYFKIASKEFTESRWMGVEEMKVKVSDAFHSNF